jgi:hypothetical protein
VTSLTMPETGGGDPLAPDAYTILPVVPASAINATLYGKLNYNFLRGIAPVAGIIRFPNVMEVNPSVPAKTVPDCSMFDNVPTRWSTSIAPSRLSAVQAILIASYFGAGATQP